MLSAAVLMAVSGSGTALGNGVEAQHSRGQPEPPRRSSREPTQPMSLPPLNQPAVIADPVRAQHG